MKTLMICESTHHGNTRKLAEAIREKFPVDLLDITEAEGADPSGYDRIGLAAGIAFGKFYPATEKFAARSLPAGKDVFLLYTCGRDSGRYTASLEKIIADRGCRFLGRYGCKGFDTYGPFRLVGGINRGHPTQEEIAGAVRFYAALEG